jgi:hypothetical protein
MMARRRIGFDRSAYAFAVAARLTDSTQIRAVNRLTIATKAIDSGVVWNRLRLVYPFVGATGPTHSLNLKNPSQFPVTWHGTLAHTAQGVVGTQGGDGWGDTGAVPTTNEAYLGLYVNQNVGPYPGRDWGSFNASDATFQSVITQWVSGEAYGDLGPAVAAPNGRLTYTPAAPTGYKAVSRVGTDQALYEANTVRASGVRTATAVATATFKLFRGRPAAEMSPGRTYAFAVAGDGLTQSQHNALFAAIQTYQTTLGRAV